MAIADYITGFVFVNNLYYLRLLLPFVYFVFFVVEIAACFLTTKKYEIHERT